MERGVWAPDLQEAGKGSLAGLHQSIPDSWAERRVFFPEGFASGPPRVRGPPTSCQTLQRA